MARAGYDPREATGAHEALNRAIDRYLQNMGRRREEPGVVGELLSTHPRHERERAGPPRRPAVGGRRGTGADRAVARLSSTRPR